MTSVNTSSDVMVKSILTIEYIKPLDKGVYTCKANNMLNSQPVTSKPQSISKFVIISNNCQRLYLNSMSKNEYRCYKVNKYLFIYLLSL